MNHNIFSGNATNQSTNSVRCRCAHSHRRRDIAAIQINVAADRRNKRTACRCMDNTVPIRRSRVCDIFECSIVDIFEHSAVHSRTGNNIQILDIAGGKVRNICIRSPFFRGNIPASRTTHGREQGFGNRQSISVTVQRTAERTDSPIGTDGDIRTELVMRIRRFSHELKLLISG